MNIHYILEEIHDEVKEYLTKGKTADYIPALANADLNKFGISVCTVNGETFSIGNTHDRFSIQSISKVFSLTYAMKKSGDKIWKRVGREPSGTTFNSLVQLEYENGIPRNPFINAGAHVITDINMSRSINLKNTMLNFVRKLSLNEEITFNQNITDSEKKTGYRNKALASLIKSFGNITCDIDELLDVYYSLCSTSMTTTELARSFLYLANEGIMPETGERIISKRNTKRILSLMLTCGLYDAVGDFAYRVGLPGKSGVSGGIVAIIPKLLSICTWSPGLNHEGNSLAGTKALELFTTKTGISVF